jgi:hypothetical protein
MLQGSALYLTLSVHRVTQRAIDKIPFSSETASRFAAEFRIELLRGVPASGRSAICHWKACRGQHMHALGAEQP